MVSNDTLRDLSERAAAASVEHWIKGLPILSGNRFLQVLEGPHPEVNALFRNIIRDPRHRDVELISVELMDCADFADWSVRLVDLFDLPGQTRKHRTTKYANKDGSILIPDRLHEVCALLLEPFKQIHIGFFHRADLGIHGCARAVVLPSDVRPA